MIIDGKRYNFDGFDKTTKTIYEFYGDFWHRNPKLFARDKLNRVASKTYSKLYDEAILRKDILKNNGFNIVSVWESDFINNNE